MENTIERTIRDTTAEPAPLGLLGFGMTTILLNIHNAGFFPINNMILVMGVFYGGLAQIIAGILESKKGNTFGTVAFTSYGCFWWSLVGIFVMNDMGYMKTDPFAMGCYLAMWGLLTFCLFMCTLGGHMIGKIIFASLTVLFFLLALANFTGSHAIHTLAGWVGIFCGFSAFYEAIGMIAEYKYEREILPMGQFTKDEWS